MKKKKKRKNPEVEMEQCQHGVWFLAPTVPQLLHSTLAKEYNPVVLRRGHTVQLGENVMSSYEFSGVSWG